MGHRHRRDDQTSAKVLAELRAMRAWMGERIFWSVTCLLALAMVSLVVAIGSSLGSSTTSTAQPPSTDPAAYFEARKDYATPGWNNESNRLAFTDRLRAYEQQTEGLFRNSGVFYNIGIDYCIGLRMGDTSYLTSAAAREDTRGETWAITNAAIDIYCPDQSQYRNLVSR